MSMWSIERMEKEEVRLEAELSRLDEEGLHETPEFKALDREHRIICASLMKAYEA